jgi:large subunit ribosomal protein L19
VAKERVQVYSGTVIARNGGGAKETFTVRRTVQGEGVERIFLVHSPKIARIEVKTAGKVRRAKLYYLRDRVGKRTKIKPDLKRQVEIDKAIKAQSEAGTKAAQEAAAKAKSEGGTSKRSAKKAAAKEAAAKKK